MGSFDGYVVFAPRACQAAIGGLFPSQIEQAAMDTQK
jgi:hypothetical protein